LAHAALPSRHRSCTFRRMQHLRFLDAVDAAALFPDELLQDRMAPL
jgi:hypothetical protein